MNDARVTNLIAAFSGLLFGIGLMVSEMVNPARVLGFLDLFNGRWDPTLAFVMGGGLLVTIPGFALARRRQQPVCADGFSNPTATAIDRPLVMGSALFGVGWGLVGLCPGPALVNIVSLQPQALLFVVAMMTGMYLFKMTRS